MGLAPTSSALNNNMATSKPIKAVRKVTFCRSVQVVLIPCIAEYREAKVMHSVWWSSVEMRQFHVDVAHTVQKYMAEVTTLLDRRQVIRLLATDPEAFMSEDTSEAGLLGGSTTSKSI